MGIAKALYVGTTANIAGTTTLAGVTATSITDSGLTSGRVTYAGTAGLLQDSANLTFNGTTLTANTIGAFTLSGTVAGGGNQLNNVIIGTTTPLAGAFTTLSATGTLSGGTSGTGYSFSGSAPATSLTLNSSGNLGLGVTPSAWNSGYSALQIKDNAIVSGGSDLTCIANAYIDSASAYLHTPMQVFTNKVVVFIHGKLLHLHKD